MLFFTFSVITFIYFFLYLDMCSNFSGSRCLAWGDQHTSALLKCHFVFPILKWLSDIVLAPWGNSKLGTAMYISLDNERGVHGKFRRQTSNLGIGGLVQLPSCTAYINVLHLMLGF